MRYHAPDCMCSFYFRTDSLETSQMTFRETVLSLANQFIGVSSCPIPLRCFEVCDADPNRRDIFGLWTRQLTNRFDKFALHYQSSLKPGQTTGRSGRGARRGQGGVGHGRVLTELLAQETRDSRNLQGFEETSVERRPRSRNKRNLMQTECGNKISG